MIVYGTFLTPWDLSDIICVFSFANLAH